MSKLRKNWSLQVFMVCQKALEEWATGWEKMSRESVLSRQILTYMLTLALMIIAIAIRGLAVLQLRTRLPSGRRSGR